jgi:hypothetical protein
MKSRNGRKNMTHEKSSDSEKSGSSKVEWSETEVNEMLEEMNERAQTAINPGDPLANYSSISPRNVREAA